MRIGLVLVLLMSTPGSVLADDIYRWVDSAGIVNFTQLRPRDYNFEQISTDAGIIGVVNKVARISEPKQSQTLTGSAKPPMTEAQRRMLDSLRTDEETRQADLAQARENNCDKSRLILARLSTSSRIRVRQDTGAHRMMPEEERQERINKAQQGVVIYCTSAS